MKPIKTASFLFVFASLVIFETLIANSDGLSTLHFISKPLIVSVLILYFLNTTKQQKVAWRRLTLLALAFSLLGDVLLLFVFKSEFFFMGGLLAFLITHTLYCIVFLKHRNKALKPYRIIALFVVYAIGLFVLLKPGLGELLIPVLVYMSVILLMGITAYLRKGNSPNTSFKLVFLGALFFIISDSILAINKFYLPVPYFNFSIMFTYALAQLLIVLGLKKRF
ncbi:lysoplasmalogenase [Bizionia gelidisalsuginis]|uniref:Lysoplasmalogenase n=1 Tax=Bizionia gelidisalsuginis TaxID=291188 RepID=A0ABY3ME75_9FLAO|nr:lysoplasmalogenase [Bizionia gelidisalsuginis]TYC17846.1 lysoplasmalogenase [Bizionia gelidisalsuginis]